MQHFKKAFSAQLSRLCADLTKNPLDQSLQTALVSECFYSIDSFKLHQAFGAIGEVNSAVREQPTRFAKPSKRLPPEFAAVWSGCFVGWIEQGEVAFIHPLDTTKETLARR